MTVALMWEAKAVEGRGEELLAWVRSRPFAGPPLRRETFTAPGERVLVIALWDPDSAPEPSELPTPPEELSARPVHRWRFERVEDARNGAD